MRTPHERATLASVMLLIAGIAFAFWLVLKDLRRATDSDPSVGNPNAWLLGFVFVLGGLSAVGPPLLLWTAKGKRWYAGRFLWFTQGTAAWLLWPPVIYNRLVSSGDRGSIGAACFYYGTPPMALYVTLSLLASGHLSRSRLRRVRLSWQETFGLLLGLVWACTGLYIISLFYREDFMRK